MAGSTCEATSEAANEGVWMKAFISDLGVIPSASVRESWTKESLGVQTI